jgi:hypothetical protein
VLDGRDIGTVICPEAEVKLFVTASDRVRAHRRWLELGGDAGATRFWPRCASATPATWAAPMKQTKENCMCAKAPWRNSKPS